VSNKRGNKPSEYADQLREHLLATTITLEKKGDRCALDKVGMCFFISSGECQLSIHLESTDNGTDDYNLCTLQSQESIIGIKVPHRKLSLDFIDKPCVILSFSLEAFDQYIKTQQTQNQITNLNVIPKAISAKKENIDVSSDMITPYPQKDSWTNALFLSLWDGLKKLSLTLAGIYDSPNKDDYSDILKSKGLMQNNIIYSAPKMLLFSPDNTTSILYCGAVKIIKSGNYYPVLPGIGIKSEGQDSQLNLFTDSEVLRCAKALTMISMAFNNIMLALNLLLQRELENTSEQATLTIKHQTDEKNIKQSIREFLLFIKYGERDSAVFKSVSDLIYACQVIFDHLGIKNILPDKKKLHIDVTDLDSVAMEGNFRYRKVKLSGTWWKNDHGPLLVYLKGEKIQPAAIIKEKKDYYLFEAKNPGRGIKINRRVAERISQEALYLYPSLGQGALTFNKLLSFSLKSIKYDLIYLCLFSLIGGALSLITPLMGLYIINLAIPDKNIFLLLMIAVMLLSILLTSSVVRFIVEYANLRIEGKLSKFVEPALVDRIIQWPVDSLNKFTTALIYMRVEGISAIKTTITKMVCTGIPSIIFLTYALSITLYLLPLAGLFLVFVLLLFIGIVIVIGLAQYKRILTGERIEGNAFNIIYQSIENMTLIRSTGIESTVYRQWAKGYNELNNRSDSSKRLSNIYQSLIAGFSIFMTGVTFIGIAFMHTSGTSLGVFIAFLYSLSLFFMFSLQFINVIYGSLQLLPSLKFSKPFLAILPERKPFQLPAPKVTGVIEVNQAYFKYRPEDKYALKNIHFEVSPGDFVGVVGESGSGKSTLLKLLLSIYQPSSGGIYYDHIDLRKIEPTSLRQQCGVVLQTSKLFPGSIYENITLKRDTSLHKVWEVIKYCGLYDEIKAFPMQVHTGVNETSSMLSSGQKQRIIMARALLDNPSILFLDEPTNLLDDYNVKLIYKHLSLLNKTRIVISHKPKELRHANKIIVMHQGEIVEMGTYNELIENQGGLFYKMIQLA